MAESLDYTTIHRRLSEARTYSYVLAATSAFLAITILINAHLFEAERQIIEARLTTQRDVVSHARAAIDHIRDYFVLHDLTDHTDRENTRTIADAAEEIREPVRKIYKVLTMFNDNDIAASIEILGYLADPDEPNSESDSRFQDPVVPSDGLKVLPLKHLVTLSFYVGTNVLTIRSMLKSLATKPPDQNSTYYQKTQWIKNLNVALIEGSKDRRFMDLRANADRLQQSITEYDRDTSPYSSPEPSTYEVALERLRSTQRQKEKHDERQREKTVSLYFLGDDIPVVVISIALPLFVMFGLLLVAMCLSYVRDKAHTLPDADKAFAVDVGLLFTELKKIPLDAVYSQVYFSYSSSSSLFFQPAR